MRHIRGLDQQVRPIGAAFDREDGLLPLAGRAPQEDRQHAHALRVHLLAQAIGDGAHRMLGRGELPDAARRGQSLGRVQEHHLPLRRDQKRQQRLQQGVGAKHVGRELALQRGGIGGTFVDAGPQGKDMQQATLRHARAQRRDRLGLRQVPGDRLGAGRLPQPGDAGRIAAVQHDIRLRRQEREADGAADMAGRAGDDGQRAPQRVGHQRVSARSGAKTAVRPSIAVSSSCRRTMSSGRCDRSDALR
jgi:hypothetical protein